MPTYVVNTTGRTLTHTCDVTSTYRGYAGTNPLEGPSGCIGGTGIAGNSANGSGLITTFFGGEFEWDQGSYASGFYGWTLKVRALGTRSWVSTDVLDTFTPPRNVTAVLNATMTATAEVECCLEIYDPAEAALIEGLLFPEYDIVTAVQDNLPATGYRFFERIKAGTDIEIEVTGGFGSVSDTISDSVTIATATEIGYEVILNHEQTSENWRGLSEIVSDWINGSTSPDEELTESNPDEYAKSTISNSGTQLTTRIDTANADPYTDACDQRAGGDPVSGDGAVTVLYAPDVDFDFAAQFKLQNLSAPSSMEVTWKDSASTTQVLTGTSVSATKAQRRYFYDRELLSIGQALINVDERAPTHAWISDAGSDDATDWRLQFRGVKWKAGSLLHEAETVLDDGLSSTGWSGGANTTYSNVGGAQRAVISGGEGSLSWSPPTDQVCEAYRYLRVRIRATGANQPFTVNLTHTEGEDKSYSGETGSAGSYADIDLDLCRPDSLSMATDEQESRWPLKEFGLPPEESGEQWGFNQFDALSITGLVDGQTYEVEKVSLVRAATGEGSILPQFSGWLKAWDSETDTTYQKPFWWANADGRVADRATCFRVVPLSGSPYLNYYSITDTLGQIEANTGWTVGGAGTLPGDGYHTQSLSGFLLCGSGATWDFTAEEWTWWIDIDFTGEEDVFAQALIDQVNCQIPDVGQAWMGGSYGGAFELRTAKVVRGLAWGLVQDSSGVMSGETVTLRTYPGAVSRGTGVTDAWGFYKTGTPYGFREEHQALHKSNITEEFDVYPRGRHRKCFYDVVSATSLWNLFTPWGHYHRLALQDAGGVTHHRATFVIPIDGFDSEAEVSASFTQARASYNPNNGGIDVIGSDGTKTYIGTTHDDGESYNTMAEIFTSPYNPHIDHDRSGHGLVAVFVYDSGTSGPGTIVGKNRNPGDTSWSSQFTFKNTGGSDIAFSDNVFSFHFAPDNSGRITMVAVKNGGSGPTEFYSTDLGETWTEV